MLPSRSQEERSVSHIAAAVVFFCADVCGVGNVKAIKLRKNVCYRWQGELLSREEVTTLLRRGKRVTKAIIEPSS